MRAFVVIGCCVLAAGCFDFAALKSDYGKDLAGPDTPDLAGADQSVVDQGGSDQAVELDMPMTLDQAAAPDQAAESDQAASTTDLATSDLQGLIDMRPPAADMQGGCGYLPPQGTTLYVDHAASSSHTACTKASPCSTIAAAQSLLSSSQPANILIAEGSYTETLSFTGPVALVGGMYSNFDCRGSDAHQTRIQGVSVGQPTLRGTANTGGQLLLDGLQVFGPPTNNVAMPLRAVWFTGIGEAKIVGSRIASHDMGTTTAQRIEVVRAETGTLVVERSTIEVPDMQLSSAAQKNAIYLCGANATLRDSRLFVEMTDASNSAVFEAQDDSGGCMGGSVNQIAVFRSIISAVKGDGTLAMRTNWIRLNNDQKLVGLQRTVLRVGGGTGASVGFYSQTPLTLNVLGSTISAGQVGTAYGISLFSNTSSPNPIVVLKDSILSAATYAVLYTGAANSSASGFERNIFQVGGATPGPNPAVINNAGTIVTKMNMQDDFAADMMSKPWGEPLFGDPKLAFDGFHLTAASNVAINQARTCWGTEGGTHNADFEGTPVMTAGNFTCDIGADEFQ